MSFVLHTCAHVWFFGSGYFFCSRVYLIGYHRGRRAAYIAMRERQSAQLEQMIGELEAQMSTSEREDFMRH